jgi:hypothetical protein
MEETVKDGGGCVNANQRCKCESRIGIEEKAAAYLQEAVSVTSDLQQIKQRVSAGVTFALAG